MSAAGSTDPDGNALSYEWIYYGEPGTFVISNGRTGAPFKIEDANKSEAWLTAPKVTKPETMHITSGGYGSRDARPDAVSARHRGGLSLMVKRGTRCPAHYINTLFALFPFPV
ncbi:MAG: hypothetical protein U0X75_20670 [Acidobacteriota bacterium]